MSKIMGFLMLTVILCNLATFISLNRITIVGDLLCSLSKNIPLSHHSINSSAKLAGDTCLGEGAAILARLGASAEYFLLIYIEGNASLG